MIEEYRWAIVAGLVLLALLVLWLTLGRRRGVGGEAAASLRDLDGSRSARPTFARPTIDPALAAPGPLAEPPPITDVLPTVIRGSEPLDSRPLNHDIAPDPVASSGAQAGDDLTRMKGLGPKLRDQLAELGVTRFDQIADWDDAAIERIDCQLGRFSGRIRRDDWVEQASFLAADDHAGYKARFGALG